MAIVPATRRIGLLGGAAVLSATVMATVLHGQPEAQFSGEGMPEGPGKAEMVRVCGLCHEPQRAASIRLTRDGWADVIDSMIKRGARPSDGDVPIILDYLATNFLGEAARPVNVNTAPQIDLESVAGLLRREARAVVAYREAHGPFETLDDMKDVPGLDFSKIDSRRDFVVAISATTPPPEAAPAE
jgi:competence protein ComEA